MLPSPPLPFLAAAAFAGEPDWAALRDETTRLLSAWLQVDTRNPPGEETAGARFLADFLEREGVATEIVEFAPGRGSLVARLEGGDEPPLCLLSHLDVATAEADRWEAGRGPLSGAVADGYVWGRGALDMKGMGAIEAMVVAMLARDKVPLRRDVVLLAVADEEVGNRGISHVIAERWDEIGCSHVVNEGGIGLRDMFFPGQTVYPISVGEKGVLWARMVAEGQPGHGSTPRPGQAPEKLLAAVARLNERTVRPRYHDALLEFLGNAGRQHGGMAGAVLRSPLLVKTLLRGRMMKSPLTRAAVTDTVNVTGFGGAREPNVVPAEVWAHVDARLLPGTTPDAMLAELQRLAGREVRFEVLAAREAAVSEWRGDPFYEALAKHVAAEVPGSVAGPVVSVGYTDSIALRPLGVRAYGFVPFAVTEAEAATMHGDDERVAVAELERGLKVLYRAVEEFAGR